MTPFCQPWGVQWQTANVEKTGFSESISGLDVDFRDPDGKVTGVRVFELRAHGCGQVDFAIIVEEEVWVESPPIVCVIFRLARIQGLNNYQTVTYWSTYIGSLHASSSQMFLVVTNMLLGVLVEFYWRLVYRCWISFWKRTSGGLIMSNQVVII